MTAWPRPDFLVGEPSGASPNFVGESIRFRLPHGKMTGAVPTSPGPGSHRSYAPPTFAVYKENRDPALEAVLAEPKR